jgi:hypothetical protein
MSAEQRQAVVQTLRNIDGVISPRFVANKDRFMMVAFDPATVQTDGLRHAFNRMGLQAKLIGM